MYLTKPVKILSITLLIVAIVGISIILISRRPLIYPYDEHVYSEHVYNGQPQFLIKEAPRGEQMRGFAEMASVYGRSYFFRTQDTEANRAFVYSAEQILRELAGLFPLDAKLRNDMRLELATNESEYRFTPPSHALADYALSIRTEYLNTMGWLAHAKSSMYLPMWLSVGMEAVARSEIGLYMPQQAPQFSANFGDIYFSPAYWGSIELYSNVAAAYHFTRFLMTEGYLSSVVSGYMGNDYITANYLAAAAFYRFAGEYALCLTSQRLIFTMTDRYHITIHTEMAYYNFVFASFDEHLTSVRIIDYVNYMDGGIQFTVDWYKAWADFAFTPMYVYIFYNPERAGGAAFSPWRIHLYSIPRFGHHSISHEASHLLTSLILQDYDKIFAPFDEGLAFYLMAKYGIHDRYGFGIGYKYRRYLANLDYDEGFISFDNSLAITNNLIDDFNFFGFDHFYAYLVLGGYFDGHCLLNWLSTPIGLAMLEQYESINYIATFETSASFVTYLIEQHGADAYMQVHFDVSSFENVYGISICEMIGRWLMYLSVFIELGPVPTTGTGPSE